MPTPKRIQLLTTNAKKLAEFRQALGLHGVSVEQIQTWSDADFSRFQLVIAEATELRDPEHRPVSTYAHLLPVLNLSRLTVYGPESRFDTPLAAYEVEIPGYLDLSRQPDGETFDWDYCFVHTGINNHSNDELRRAGIKFSARQKAIGEFARDFLRLPRRHQFNFTPLDQPTTIDFSGPGAIEILADNPYLAAAPPTIRALLDTVLAQGVFLRLAKNRRERNYWLPGLNAGVPATPKKDSLHETTFLVHDLMHHLFADLCLLDDSAAARAVYVVQRMMSEAFTLVLADMLFVDGLIKAGFDYDFAKRRIHPLYADLCRQGPPDLEALLWASVRLCLAGDEAPYRALGAGDEALAAFRAKYDAFFVRDYEWTLHNAEILAQPRKQAAVRQWFESFAPVLSQLQPALQTTASFEAGLPPATAPGFFEAVLKRVFAAMSAQLSAAMTAPARPDPESARLRAFRKYMAGQSFMYFELGEYYPQILPHAALIREALLQPQLEIATLNRLRAFYAHGLEVLAAQNMLLNRDDLDTYRELYPLFLPAYVSYDAPLELSLAEMVTRLKSVLAAPSAL